MRLGSEQERHALPQGGDLRQRQVHEDHAAGQHVLAEGGKDQHQKEAREERQRHDRKKIHCCAPVFPESAPAMDDTRTSNLEKTSSVPGRPPASLAISMATPPAFFATWLLASAS